MRRFQEIAAFFLLLILGLAPRLAFISTFPTIPVSDFNVMVVFGQMMRDLGVAHDAWYWEFFNPGVPLVLAGLFRAAPHVDPAALARLATAIVTGLMALPPLVIWRGVFPLWIRFLCGAALALWPGQILFCGVVAQDNWILLPSVALAALAIRALRSGKCTAPILAGLLFVAVVAIRQEMLAILLPLLLVSARVDLRAGWSRSARAILTAALALVALAAYRQAATGRFTLSTQHTGTSVLGAYVPGAAANAWVDPSPFIASVQPDLLHHHNALVSQAMHLALREALRRPWFHAERILMLTLSFAKISEATSVYWSVGAPDVLPPSLHERGAALAGRVTAPLRWEMAAIQGLFLAAVIIGIRRRNAPLLLLALVVLLKYGLHAVTVPQGRFFFVATAWEILALPLALHELVATPPPGVRWLVMPAAVGVIFSFILLLFAPRFALYVTGRDIDPQRTYRFSLTLPEHDVDLDCTMRQGLLVALNAYGFDAMQSAVLRTFEQNPAPGDKAAAVCELTGSGKPRPLFLQVFDPYAPGGLAGRMVQRVELDGVEVFSHDIAREPGTGWANISLGNVGTGTTRRHVVIELKALQPDPGASWGDASQTTVQLSRPE